MQKLFLLPLLWLITIQCLAHNPSEFSIKLIRYESPKSPFYSGELTLEERIRKMNERSEARIADMMFALNNPEGDEKVAIRGPSSSSGQFLVPLYIGTPQVYQVVILDTGSTLFWIDCAFSDTAPPPYYNSEGSSTYAEDVDCWSPMCSSSIGGTSCDIYDLRCFFYVKYGKGESRGHLASEVVEFRSKLEAIQFRVVFGCSVSFKKISGANGILGLSNNNVSLINQRNYTAFSYCFGDMNQSENETDVLILGALPADPEIFNIQYTPMIMDAGKYYIELYLIYVGDKVLDIDPSIFKRVELEGGMIIDSGTTSSYLPRVALITLKEEIRSFVGTKLKPYRTNDPEELCYNGILKLHLSDVPTIIFQFAEYAFMTLAPQSIFYQKLEYFCLSIQASESKGLPFSLLGIWAQQQTYIGFDFESMMVSFTGMDCSLL